MSVRDGVISLSKEPLWLSALVSHVEPLLLSATSLGYLFAANSLYAPNSSESESSPVDRDFRFLAGSAVVGVWVSPFCFNVLIQLLTGSVVGIRSPSRKYVSFFTRQCILLHRRSVVSIHF